MSLYTQIKTEQLEARKAKLQLQTNLYTTLLGEIQSATTGTKNGSSEISDSEVLRVINKFIKNAKETLKLKPDNVTVSLELKILETFLPKQLSDEELKSIVLDIKSKCHSTLQPNAVLGFVMKELKSNYQNQYDASKVKDIVLDLCS